jgi:hypothetical protein
VVNNGGTGHSSGLTFSGSKTLRGLLSGIGAFLLAPSDGLDVDACNGGTAAKGNYLRTARQPAPLLDNWKGMGESVSHATLPPESA